MDLKELSAQNSNLRHPWEMSRSNFFEHLIRHCRLQTKPINALDIGSGDTWLARRLLENLPSGSTMTCVDRSFTAEQIKHFNAQQPNVKTFNEVPNDQKFDLVFLLDVIEHVPNDREFLNDIRDRVKSNGLMIISVPAYQSLFSAHDTWLDHYRRYSPSAGKQLVKDCQLKILETGGLFHGLLYVRILEKIMEKVSSKKKTFGVSHWNKSALVTNLISFGLNLDWRLTELLRKVGLKIPGLSWWCVCRKD